MVVSPYRIAARPAGFRAAAGTAKKRKAHGEIFMGHFIAKSLR
jgi:hypothetical protein